tara:strand:- start:187 stop:861 length:675 start_codon:yes stop_codon:yes gene_type:complete
MKSKILYTLGMATIKALQMQVGSLSNPSKMPGFGYSTPAKDCQTGSKLAKIVNSICSICYAKKGRYVFPNVQNAMQYRLDSLNKIDWIDCMVELISKKQSKLPEGQREFFRWHDSGDIQGVWHLEKIAEIARRLPEINFWLPTREYRFVREWLATATKPNNLQIRLSAYMIDGKPPTELANRLGLTTSGVSQNGFNCPAPKQDNACGDCRACWTSDENINYKSH